MIVKILGFTRYFHICTTTHHFRSLQCCQWLSSHLKSSYYPHRWWHWLKSFLLWNFTEPRNTNTTHENGITNIPYFIKQNTLNIILK